MFRTWLRRRRRRHTRPTRHPAAPRPLVELLEDRRLLNAGSLDPFFGFLGRTVTPNFASAADAADATAFQADNKLIVAGASAYGPADSASDGAFALARYDNNGNLDPSFGIGGRATAFFGPELIGPGTVSVATATAVAVQPDGKIVAAGVVNTGFSTSFAVARFTRNGWLDPTFGTGGEVVTQFGPVDSTAAAVTVQADGKIVVVGQEAGTDFALARYTTAGALDTGFGSGGEVHSHLTGGTDAAEAVTVQASGEIVVAGSAVVFSNITHAFQSNFALLRYNGNNGWLDSSSVAADFGVNSGVPVNSDARAVTVLADGTIRAAGRAGSNMGLAQYTSVGVVTSTATPQFVFTFAPAGEGVSFSPSGQVVVVGSTGGASSDFGVERYTAAGAVDTTFGSGGTVTTDFGGNDAAAAVAVKADGTLAVAGSTDSNLGDFAVARYRANGSLLTTFNHGGKVTTDFLFSTVEPTNPVFGPPVLTSGFTVALPGGGFLVAGTVAPDDKHGEFLLARYTADGRLDTTFGDGGEVVTSFGPDASASAAAIAVGPDGSIVIAGTVSDTAAFTSDFAVARYNPDGSGIGTFTFAIDGSSFNVGSGVAVQPDGKKIVIVGTTSDPNTGDNDFALVRINLDGTPDNSFGTGGEVFTDFGAIIDPNTYVPDFINAEAAGVVLLNNGQILVGGTAFSSTTFYDDLAVARYGSDGTLDATFGTAGLATADFGAEAVGSSIAVAPGGAIVVGGTTQNLNGATGFEQDFALAQFTPGGLLDGSFGTGGMASFAFDGQIYDGASIAIQSDGKILIAGTRTDTTTFNSDFALARVKIDGTLDTSFGTGGLVTTDFGGTDVAASVVLAPDGRIVVGGSAYGNGGGFLALACYFGDRRDGWDC